MPSPVAAITLQAMVVTTIRPDTVFIPYHWPGRKSANQLTISAQDPISKIPAVQGVCGPHRKADGRRNGPGVWSRSRDKTIGASMSVPGHLNFYIDPSPLHRVPGVRAGMHRVRHAQGDLHDPPGDVDRAHSTQTIPVVCMHCDSPTCAEVCPADAIKRTRRRGAVGPQAALHRLQQLRAGVPLRVPKLKVEFES
jgi:predicted molibdopterin-dependent oxidoreductase YjgC